MQTKKRVTIKEVARIAGVSTQTVSRVLNQRPDVSSDTRARIQSVIAELGYSPNALARSLIQGRSHTIGVVGYGLSYYGPSRVVTGIERRANELGYTLLLSLLREPERTPGEDVLRHLLDRQVDGVIWAVPEIGENRDWIARRLQRAHAPVVCINTDPAAGLAVAAIDNRAGGRMAVEHLLDQGYRRIGIITGPDSWWESRQRAQGWRDAMQARGLQDDPPCSPSGLPGDLQALRVAGDWYPASGEAGLETLLRRCPDLQAVFACNDPMAAGALRAARRLGRRVPADLAVIGYDDTPEAPYYSPALSTIRQPLVEMGSQAVDLLHCLLQECQPPQAEQIRWLQPQLVVRESSQPA